MEDLPVGLWLVVGGFVIHPMFENTLVKQKIGKRTYESTGSQQRKKRTTQLYSTINIFKDSRNW